jgi:hypothetical protein
MSRTLSTIPDKIIEKIKHAQRTGKLDLSAASLTDLPEEILALTNLRTLNLYHNPIKILPTRLLMLTTLRELTLYRTRLIKVPTQLSALVHLTKLHMGSNRLTDLPSEIFALTQLQEIDLSNNQLRVLPSALSRCSALRMVVGFRNRLESLPDCLSTLTALRKLDLRSNELRALPPSLGCLTALQTLLLNDNPLQTPPNFVCQRGRRAVLAFLYQQHQQRHLCTCAAECVVTFFDGGVSPKAYSATGPRPVPRLEVGREHFVRIHARSADRKPRTCGGDVFRASLHRVVGPNATATEEVSALLVRDLGTGVYEVRFCVTLAGLYRLHLTLVNTTNWAVDNVNKHLEKTVSSQSQAVAGSPFPLHLIPSTVSVVHCTAAGSGLEGGVVGIPATFIIRAVDKYGNSTSLVAESDEREQFTVVIDAPDKTTLQSEVTVDREDASLYRVRYTATTPGTHLVSVTLAGLHIRGSPFTVPVIGAITSTAPNETLSTLQSQLHEELIRQAELQRLCSKAERHIGGLKARVAQERQSVRDLLEQRTKLQCELDHLRLTFGELKTAHVRLEEDALLCIHNITIAEWKCSLENKLHDTLRKLEREIRDRSLLEELIETLRCMLEMEVQARTRLELLRQQLASQIDDVRNSLCDLNTLQLQLETELLLHEENAYTPGQYSPHPSNEEVVNDDSMQEPQPQRLSNSPVDKENLEQAKKIVLEETVKLRQTFFELQEAHAQLTREIAAVQDMESWQKRLEEEAQARIRLHALHKILRDHSTEATSSLMDTRRKEIEKEIAQIESKLTFPFRVSSELLPSWTSAVTDTPEETKATGVGDAVLHNKSTTNTVTQPQHESYDSKTFATSTQSEEQSLMRALSVGSRLSAMLPKNISTSLFLTAAAVPTAHNVPADRQRLEYRKSINACKLSFFEKLKFWQSADSVPVGLVYKQTTSLPKAVSNNSSVFQR